MYGLIGAKSPLSMLLITFSTSFDVIVLFLISLSTMMLFNGFRMGLWIDFASSRHSTSNLRSFCNEA